MQDKRNFDWSLKPIVLIARFIIGAPLDFTNKKKNILLVIIIPLFGCFTLLCNILLNGPRGINTDNFKWSFIIEEFESPYLLFKEHPDLMLQLVVDVTSICFFVVVPLVQLVFLFIVLFSQYWNRLTFSLVKAQKEMQLSENFHRKCRKRCIVSILLLILVSVKSLFISC